MRLTRVHYWRILWDLGNLWGAGKSDLSNYPCICVEQIYAALQVQALPASMISEYDLSRQFKSWLLKRNLGGKR